MRKLKAWWRAIPRPIHIVRNLVLAVILFALFYIFHGSPDMTVEQAYRRAEARNLVGPGEILGVLDVQISGGYTQLLLAETDEGVIQYCFRQENLGFVFGPHTVSSYEGDLIYREKQGPVSIMAATGQYSFSREELSLPIILFDDCPKAVRAEVELRLTGEYNSSEYDYFYCLSSQRKSGGFFVFDLETTGGGEREAWAISQVSELYSVHGGSGTAVPATVRLYDQNEEVIYDGEVLLQSDSDAAHARYERKGA